MAQFYPTISCFILFMWVKISCFLIAVSLNGFSLRLKSNPACSFCFCTISISGITHTVHFSHTEMTHCPLLPDHHHQWAPVHDLITDQHLDLIQLNTEPQNEGGSCLTPDAHIYPGLISKNAPDNEQLYFTNWQDGMYSRSYQSHTTPGCKHCSFSNTWCDTLGKVLQRRRKKKNFCMFSSI